jgi:hypothetical protein
MEEHVQYQLEEKMGDGKWSRVTQTKEEADYESPSYVSFPTAHAAREYGNTDVQRWSKGGIERGVVRVVVVTTTVQPLPDLAVLKTAKRGDRHYHAKDALLELTYADSLYGVRLYLTDDGRKRGLWVWLEEDAKIRIEQDWKMFERCLEKFKAWLDDPKKGYAKEPDMLGFMLRSIHFDYFFGHRTEASAIRLSWRKSKLLAAALNKAHRDEKNKTLEDYDDAYGKDPERDEDEDTEEDAA